MLKRSHTVFAAALLAIGLAAMAPAGASTQLGVNLVIGTAPPLPRFESVPPPRHGYVWAPGYWGWNGRHHVWLAGRWEPERYGYQYRPAVWLRDGDGWRLDEGGWVTVESRPLATDYVQIAPPAPRYERVPAARPGYLWSPGYWEWRHGRYEWIMGDWIPERPGYVYYEPRWIQHDGRWLREEARWERHERHERERWERRHGDRDHDGIPNRYDHDRDGDGVPNRYDRHPDNPHRD